LQQKVCRPERSLSVEPIKTVVRNITDVSAQQIALKGLNKDAGNILNGIAAIAKYGNSKFSAVASHSRGMDSEIPDLFEHRDQRQRVELSL
jgi:hypothetical protein